MLIHFSSIVKPAMFAYVNQTRISSWNQPVLSNEGKVSFTKKQWDLLLGLELTTDRHSLSKNKKNTCREEKQPEQEQKSLAENKIDSMSKNRKHLQRTR